MTKLTVKDLEIRGKRVLLRVDFNVPLEAGAVANDKRIRAALPTIRYVIENGGKLVLISHLGRPKGRRVPEMSLRPCAAALRGLLGKPVSFAEDCVGPPALTAAQALGEGDVLLLENLRYYREETDNDPGFAEELSKLGDLFVNDAFGTAHRAHASTVGVTRYFHQCAAGFLMVKELEYLGKALENPESPFLALMGGAKISGKIDVISNLLPRVDRVVIGGGMSFTFFKARGLETGKSLLEEDKIDVAAELLKEAGEKITLPVDCVVTDLLDLDAREIGPLHLVESEAIPPGTIGVDIGPGTLEEFGRLIGGSRTIVWNGPMGVFEIDAAAKGTYAVARMLADATERGAITIIGGGDSAAAVEKAGVADRVSHVSTGGGASLEFLEGKTLPGVEALTDK